LLFCKSLREHGLHQMSGGPDYKKDNHPGAPPFGGEPNSLDFLETAAHSRRCTMKLIVALLGLGIVIGAGTSANAKGCVKGAIVVGVAGHLVGHGAAGAAAGCIVGHHEANKRQNATPNR
jgi:hypothetical protein